MFADSWEKLLWENWYVSHTHDWGWIFFPRCTQNNIHWFFIHKIMTLRNPSVEAPHEILSKNIYHKCRLCAFVLSLRPNLQREFTFMRRLPLSWGKTIVMVMRGDFPERPLCWPVRRKWAEKSPQKRQRLSQWQSEGKLSKCRLCGG